MGLPQNAVHHYWYSTVTSLREVICQQGERLDENLELLGMRFNIIVTLLLPTVREVICQQGQRFDENPELRILYEV